MRILLDCRMATWTGVGRYTTGLVNALAATGELELVCVSAPDVERVPDAARRVEAVHSPLVPAGMLEFGRVAREVAPDVTHGLHFPTPIPARHPYVATLHDVTPLVLEGVMESASRRAVYRWMNARVTGLADALVYPSHHTAADVERLFPRARGKGTVVLEAADDFAAGPVAAPEGALAELTRARYVLSMGSTRTHKDLPTLLRAFARLAADDGTLRLLLVGAEAPGFVDGVLGEEPATVRSRVAFTGRVTDAELRALYAGAAVFAFPSRYEGFGLPPLEAMAMGAPVVVAKATSLPEVVGDAALLHPAGDDVALAAVLRRVLVEPDVRDQLIAGGRARSAELTWDAAARATIAVYRSVVRG